MVKDKNSKLDRCYMDVAISHSVLSHGVRSKVGACLVLDSGVMLGGCNGLPKLLGNVLEENNVTKQEVIHAELNCIVKAAKEGLSVQGARLYVTLSPCRHCSSLMVSCGISEVIYLEEYRDTSGLDILKQCGVKVRKYVGTRTHTITTSDRKH